MWPSRTHENGKQKALLAQIFSFILTFVTWVTRFVTLYIVESQIEIVPPTIMKNETKTDNAPPGCLPPDNLT